jgi:hypothetical protein
MGQIMNLAISHLAIPSTFETSCQVLVELLALPDLTKYEDSICENLLPVLTTGIVRDEFAKAIEGNTLAQSKVPKTDVLEYHLNNRTRPRYRPPSLSTLFTIW